MDLLPPKPLHAFMEMDEVDDQPTPPACVNLSSSSQIASARVIENHKLPLTVRMVSFLAEFHHQKLGISYLPTMYSLDQQHELIS